ncbi:MAG: DNA primase [Alphaproteobacteria bacterium]|nr:DNA primase [Alphaproteobacteria bacterium]MBU1520177.1 DNA primase [Alphaproteobacteria bacterium]MBU2029227.1 DNA primase [Alphaproteobacteria bacterium]MBU2164404.1 DNA primase [Alphaproteobacteria bacterium]MBU2231512.1 DNA primase [Alphaproteobacteria bacterium]
MDRPVRFDERFIDELKARLRPSDVIGRTVKLKRQGREYVGLSPFSKEKSPSFFVNDDKGFFHDFSSGKHGDIISFLQETERLSFVEAVQRLAGEAGMQLPAEDPKEAEREQKRQGLSDWMDLAQKWFAANLRRTPGKAAREYLEKRGLPEDQWERFGLGYAPNDREGLKQALVQRGARPAELVEAGLLISPESGGQPYDRFRDRLMFPILDARGRIVSFGGRAMNPDDRAKYLNGPESPLFHKGATLYGLPEARRILGAESRNDQAIIVVEGYMDVIACQRAGLPAVAPMGTALTEEQMERLWRVSHEPVLCFDGDAAGLRAAYRAIERSLPLLKAGRSFRFSLLSGGQDPDDILRDKGAPALRQALADTHGFAEVLFRREQDVEPLDTPERKAGFKARLRTAASAIQDKDLAEQYRRDLFDRFDALFPRAPQRAPWTPGQGRGRFGPPPKLGQTVEGAQAMQSLFRAVSPVAAALAYAAIDDIERLDDHLEEVSVQGFGDAALEGLAQELVRLRLSGQPSDAAVVRRRLRDSGFDPLLKEIEKAASKSGASFLSSDLTVAESRAHWLKVFGLMTHLAALSRAIETAKQDMGQGTGIDALVRLKAERDAITRSFAAPDFWTTLI